MLLIEDPYADTRGWIIFPILSADCYEGIATFYSVTGALPMAIEERPDDEIIAHLVRLCHLPSLNLVKVASVPEFTLQYQSDSLVWGISRLVIRDNEKRCVVRYERDSSGSGWLTYANDKPRLKYFTD